MKSIKNEITILYVFRHGIMALLIAYLAAIIDLMMYYEVPDLLFVVKKITADNMYTTIFVLLIWLLNYMLYETYTTCVELIEQSIGKIKLYKDIDLVSVASIILPILVSIIMFLFVDGILVINTILLTIYILQHVVIRFIKNMKKVSQI